ncbi:MAG: hypothetical protein HON55_00875 [Legionellales bacterium]|jgi:type II secretory pathway component PulF|nr:hypothetical protein [Legionellales bacterium]
MKLFSYKGRDINGNMVSGRIFSATVNIAAKKLFAEQVIPIFIKEVSFYTNISYKLKPLLLRFAFIDKQDLVRFCSEMSLLLRSGVPIRQAVANLAMSLKGKILKQILEIVVARMDAGYSVSESFSGFPRVFPDLFLGFLKQADYAEYSSVIFSQLGETIAARKQIKKEMIEAVIPFTSSIAMIVLAGYILSQVVMPELLRIYAEKGRELPVFTELLANFFDFIENSFVYIVVYSVSSVAALRFIAKRFSSMHYIWDKYMLQLPVYRLIRVVLVKMDFSRAIAMSLHNGYPIQQVLHISSAVVLDKYFQEKIKASVAKIVAGEDLIESIKTMELFTFSEIEILEVGKQTEALEESFKNVIAFNQNDLKHRIHILKETLNLLVLVFMVFMICFYMVGFYLGYLYLSF